MHLKSSSLHACAGKLGSTLAFTLGPSCMDTLYLKLLPCIVTLAKMLTGKILLHDQHLVGVMLLRVLVRVVTTPKS